MRRRFLAASTLGLALSLGWAYVAATPALPAHPTTHTARYADCPVNVLRYTDGSGTEWRRHLSRTE